METKSFNFFFENWHIKNLLIIAFVIYKGGLCATIHDSQFKVTIDSNTTCGAAYSCINCTTVQICLDLWNGSFTQVAEFLCDKEYPYCDESSGTCRKTPSNVTCGTKAPDFLCSHDGFFPHPSNCHKYYSCAEGEAYLNDCGINYYNPKSESCQEFYSCSVINCEGKSGAKVAHEGDPSYFGYCINSTIFRIDKCPGQFQLDTVSQLCVPVCEAEGVQGDPYDCTKYYKCFREITSASKYSLNHVQCPQGELFDALNLHCSAKSISLTCQSGQTYVDKIDIA